MLPFLEILNVVLIASMANILTFVTRLVRGSLIKTRNGVLENTNFHFASRYKRISKGLHMWLEGFQRSKTEIDDRKFRGIQGRNFHVWGLLNIPRSSVPVFVFLVSPSRSPSSGKQCVFSHDTFVFCLVVQSRHCEWRKESAFQKQQLMLVKFHPVLLVLSVSRKRFLQP